MSYQDEYYMEFARKISKHATCDRLHVGCVLVKDDNIIASGCNDSIDDHSTCDEVGHLMYERGCQRTIHAEMNAILEATSHGISTKGSTAYVTHYPCPYCMKMLNQAGITKIIYEHYYKHRFNNSFDTGMEVLSLEKLKDL